VIVCLCTVVVPAADRFPYDLAGGYTNLAGWAASTYQHPTPNWEERQ